MKFIFILIMLLSAPSFANPRVFDYRVVLGKNVDVSTEFFNAVIADGEKKFLDKFNIQLRLKRVILDNSPDDPTLIDAFYSAERYIFWNKKYRNVLYRKLYTSVWVEPYVTLDGIAQFAGQADAGKNQFNGVSLITPEPKDAPRTAMIFAHEMAHNFGALHLNTKRNIMHADAQRECKDNYASCPFDDYTKAEVLSWIYLTTKLKRRCRFYHRKLGLLSPICYSFAN